MLTAIWAQDENGLIGKKNHLPWRLPNDLKFFKETTENNVIVMGRKTFEGMGKRPLPNRQTIVLTSDEKYTASDSVIILHSLEEVLNFSKETEKTVFIAGGAQIYKQFEPYLDELLRTTIEATFTGDAHFPSFDYSKWKLVKTVQGIVDEKNIYPYKFETFIRV
ncbi:MAG: dihydrofolate reductase [Lactobacillales bacterium]|jgi:dihydrofolate reductase|nr:dihydrofolate reductase [Lactobacillales bacterium]